MRILTVFVLLVFVAGSGLLAGCSSTADSSWCCAPGAEPESTDAACRCGTTCMWPPERHTLERGEVPLTPSLNKFLCCPTFDNTYRYTRAPIECDDGTRRAGARR